MLISLGVHFIRNDELRHTVFDKYFWRTTHMVVSQRVAECRMEKDKQQLVIEIDSISSAFDAANKAKVRLLAVRI